MSSAIRKTVLPNGLRVISERITSIRSIAIGAWVDVGSRYEREGEKGVSHLIEHMHFKGTSKRPAGKIANAIEQLGGGLNAFTSREQTCYYARILDEHLPQAIDVLSDMLLNSTHTPSNLKREKQVVLEEIKESEDTPSDLVHELFLQSFWGRHPLGHSILGDSKSIRDMSRKTLIDYIGRHYNCQNIVIAASGNLDHDELVRLAQRKFRFHKGEKSHSLAAVPPSKSQFSFVEKDIAQTHFMLGFPSVDFNHPMKFAALGLNFYLGGGMSSVLFQEIREKRGLAYSIYSFQDFYRDTGAFGVFFSAEGKNLPLALQLVRKEIAKVKSKPLAKVELEKIRAQIKGSMTFAMESATGRMNRLARHELMVGKQTSLLESFKSVEKMTANDILETARMTFDESRMIGLSLGTVKKSDFPGLRLAS